MLKSILFPISVLAVSATAALAMSEGMAALDTTGDGMLGLEELQAAFPEIDGDSFLTLDSNGDGLLDADEVTAAEATGLLPASGG